MRASPTEVPNPPEEGLRIWRTRLDTLSEAEISELYAILDETEQTRAARFHFGRDRKHYIAARGMLRELVGTAVGIRPPAVRFTYGSRGKPAVAETRGGAELHFNLSHSCGSAMFVLAWNRDVGIDLESTTRLTDDDVHLSALAARILSKDELKLWQRLPDPSTRQLAFLRAWTRKEAYAKATGDGIFDGLREIEVILDALTPEQALTISTTSSRGRKDWTIHDLAAPSGFVAAVAIARS